MLSEGYNYYTGSAAKTIKLPASPTVGDVVYVKAEDLGDGNALIVSGGAPSRRIDGLVQVSLESDYAAAEFCLPCC